MPDRVISGAMLLAAVCACTAPQPEQPEPTEAARVRVALFNIKELTVEKLAERDATGRGSNPQLRAAAQIIERIQPDVLVLQEIDFPALGDDPTANARAFVEAYLENDWPYLFVAPSNTGTLSGLDLDGDGVAASDAQRGERAYGNDSWGYGVYPGQYAMALLSRLPIDRAGVRTFQKLLWRELPGHHMPADYYSDEASSSLRLSSKSHWDVPIEMANGERMHLWISHPTPPSFDGPEDRNGRRNHDEVGFWVHYIEGNEALVDDAGSRGGYHAAAPFVIVGDLNARPQSLNDFAGGRSAISQLLEHPQIQDSGTLCFSAGALAGREPGPPDDWQRATAGFLDGSRVDYVLPSRELVMIDGGVYWPSSAEDAEGAALAEAASDHRLVWLDLKLPQQ